MNEQRHPEFTDAVIDLRPSPTNVVCEIKAYADSSLEPDGEMIDWKNGAEFIHGARRMISVGERKKRDANRKTAKRSRKRNRRT